jgi:iron(III) transport system ATP-binding protein
MSSSALVVRGVTKTFPGRPAPVKALRGVDLTLPIGGIVALLGPSGCGKTTLLRLIAGFERLDEGEIYLAGNLVSSPGLHDQPERRRVGIVPQEGALFPHLTVAQNIGFGLRRGQKKAARVKEMLELVELSGFERRMPHELSGGQQQRVALARALAPAPDLVLLDEPFTALDVTLRASVRADVRRLLRAAGATALLVTHDQEEALSTADLVAVMRDGRIVQCDDPATLYSNPVDPQVAAFVGDAMLLPARFADGRAETAIGLLHLHEDGLNGRGTVVVRPEQLAVQVVDPEAAMGTVVDTEFFGHDALVRVALRDGSIDSHVVARVMGPVPRRDTPVVVETTGPVRGFADPN